MSMSDWPRLLLGLGLIYAIFQGTASVLGSDRGPAGIVVGAVVVVVTLAVDRVLLGEPLPTAARILGLGRPASAARLDGGERGTPVPGLSRVGWSASRPGHLGDANHS